MQKKLVLASLVMFAAGVFVGGNIPRLHDYAQAGVVSQDARALLQLIKEYRTTNGSYPSHQWFESLDSRRITSEGRLWVYYNPPRNTDGKRQLLISAPVQNGRMYICGYTDGFVVGQTAQDLK